MDSRIDSTPTSSEQLVVCCYCNNSTFGAHHCLKCSKPCHAVAPCSLTNAGEEGNGGKQFICCDCWLNIHIDANVANTDNSNPTTSQQIDACETSQATTDNNDDPNDEPSMSLSSRKRRQQLTIKDKLDILDFAKNSSIRASSKHFNVDRQNIREWMKQEQNLRESLDSDAKRKRLIGGGRKLSNANFDKTLADWVKDLREKNLRVTRNMIVARAQQISGNYDNLKNFSASHGWLECFMTRHNFSLRQSTTVAQKVPEPHGAIPNGLPILQQCREEEGTVLLKGVEEINLGEEEAVQSDVSIDTNC